jgi:uncharacterized membrane protein
MMIICNTMQSQETTPPAPIEMFPNSVRRRCECHLRAEFLPRQTADDRSNDGGLSSTLQGNIGALRERRKKEKRDADSEEKLADAITAFTGSMRFVYLYLVMYGAWIAWNLAPRIPHFDPTFVILAMAASVEAISLSTFVLISQNSSQAATGKRDDLDLHINLLAEPN